MSHNMTAEKPAPGSVRVTLYLSEATARRLDEYAQAQTRSRSNMAEVILRQALGLVPGEPEAEREKWSA